ncbi:ATP-binding protein [Halobaculum limi]|uniref:ATP-binding protein n=1 Tax=Halobaculum limi TaxID=3031916 RepID=UPI0024071323|nr:ATP-binding protein [Halobaculum sp. YSMS11]
MTSSGGSGGPTDAAAEGMPESTEPAVPPWRSPALAVGGAFTAALVVLTAGFAFTEADRTAGSLVLGLVGPLAAVWAYGVVLAWVARVDPPRRHHTRLTGWLVVGVIPFVVGGVINQAYMAAVGSLTGVSATAAGWWACGGVVFGAAVGIGDVRVRMRTAEAEAANARNERFVEVLTVLNRVLRHDVRNDLTVIAGYIDLARRESDPSIHEYLDGIQNRAERIERLSDHAALAEDAVMGEDTHTGATDMARVVRRVVGAIDRDYPEATVSLRVDAADRTAWVPDHDLLESAIHNVVENAVEHADHADPTVDVVVQVRDAEEGDAVRVVGGDGPTAAGEVVEVVVTDDGPGFPDRERTVLEEGGEEALEHSSGMGLWVVHWIVDAVGGETDVTSRDGDGSVVTLRFPRVDEDASADDE